MGGTVGALGADGKPAPNYRETQFSNQWDGERLVLKTETYLTPGRDSAPSSSHQEIWSFDAKGRLIVIVTDQPSGLEPKTWSLVYRRF